MIHKMIVEIDTETREEANSIACDIEQTLSGRDLAELFGTSLRGAVVFPHQEHIKVRTITPSDNEELLIAKAREEKERDGEIEFDDEPVVSRGEDRGAYVQAWVWVYDPTCKHCELPLTKDKGVLIDSTGGDVCGARSADTSPGDNLPHELEG